MNSSANPRAGDTVRVELVAIGDELLGGRTLDRNGAALGRALDALGLRLDQKQVVRDEEDMIVAALRLALTRSQLVVVCGGLGPTTDDRTRDAAAQLMGVRCVEHPEAVAAVRLRRQRQGRPFDAGARTMASLPEGAVPLVNPAGTAPGFRIEHGGSSAVFLPGVPREFEAMLPAALEDLGGADGREDTRRLTLSVFGTPESELDRLLRPLEERPRVLLHYGVRFPVIRVTLAARGAAARSPEWDTLVGRFRELVGERAYADGDVPLAAATLAALRARGLRLAVAESCTGGLVGHLLTEIPGASEQFALGVVSYANSAKRDVLGVEQDTLDTVGAVSRETVLQMAEGVRRLGRADIGVAISGIAGPGGGSDDKPVGLVYFGLATPDGSRHVEAHFAAPRDAFKQWAAHTALDLVRRYCSEGQET